MSRLSLRWRVALAFAATGMILSLAFAAATTYIAEDYEHILVSAILNSQSEHYLTALSEQPQLVLPQTAGFSVFRPADAPAEFQSLPGGIHEFDVPELDGIHVGVFGEGAQRLILLIDLGEIEALEDYLSQLMLMIMIAGTMLSGWLGWLLAGKAVRPVQQLAEAVQGLPVRPVRTQLASRFGAEEVARLAHAIDHYQWRLSEAEAAEQNFHANASHELRTPITIVQGAIEVMRDDPVVAERQQPRLDRVDRAIDELALLLEALLLGGRALPDDGTAVPLSLAVDAALDRATRCLPGSAQRLQLDVVQDNEVRVPRRWLDAILNVLLHRVISRTPGVIWALRVDRSGLTLTEQGHAGQGPHTAVDRSDIGLGLLFVERLCHELGWYLTQGFDGQGCMQVCLIVNADLPDVPA